MKNSQGDLGAWIRYGATVARTVKPRPRDGLNGIDPIDMHGHAASAAAISYVNSVIPKKPASPGLSPLADAMNALHAQDTDTVLVTPKMRIEDLDKMGIARQVVWVNPQVHSYNNIPVEIAVRASQLTNEGMAEFASHDPRRFIPTGTLPFYYPDEAVAEMDRAVKTLGIKGFMLLGNLAGKEISDPLFEKFWAKAEELGVLIFIHGSGNSLNGRLNRHNLINAIGNPLETTVALSFLISDGVLERYPRLKILGAHGAGFLGAYLGRSDHNWFARADGFNGLPHPPTYYLKRNVYFDSVVFTPEQLRFLIETYGADHVVMGTDYPFMMGEFEPVEHIVNLEKVDDAAKRAVLQGTAMTLLS